MPERKSPEVHYKTVVVGPTPALDWLSGSGCVAREVRRPKRAHYDLSVGNGDHLDAHNRVAEIDPRFECARAQQRGRSSLTRPLITLSL